ncbi:MAG: hypothetical protein H7Y86_10780 [Rhizobacter sp.]|nr:hypothetical protein [Ferruginibacter sp.]
MAITLMNAMKAVGADSLNGDTMFAVTEDYITASDSLQCPVAMQPRTEPSGVRKISRRKEMTSL